MKPNSRRQSPMIANLESDAARAVAGRSFRFGRSRKRNAAGWIESLERRALLAGNLTITPTFDSTITVLPNAAAIEASINAAISNIEANVTSNAAVNVTIDYESTDSGVSDSLTPQMDLAYSTYLADLEANPNKSANDVTALATMPTGTNTGINNATQVLLTAANLAAVGDTTDANSLVSGNGGFDGVVQFNFSVMNVSRPDANPNNFDLQSAATHETDEVLGIGGNGTTLFQPGSTPPSSLPTDVAGLDFFRYSAAGVRSFTYDASTSAYFSINGGATNLVFFNQQNGADGADFGDWGSPTGTGGNSPPQVQDAFGTPGTSPNLGANEIIALDVIGWNLISQGNGPIITLNPASQSVNPGASVSFTASAIGTPTPTVQWQVSTDGGTTFTDIAGATSTTLTLTASQSLAGNEYQAVFTNSAGTATTTAATLSVSQPLIAPIVTSNPTSENVAAGDVANFTAAAIGSPTPTVQWQVSTDGGFFFTNISGATSDTLSFAAAQSQSGNEYRAVFTNSQRSAATSAATLTVSTTAPVFVITSQPVNQSVISGQAVQFVAAVSDIASATVQWQLSTNQTTYSNIPGATSPTLDFTALAGDNGNLYRAVFTSAVGTVTTASAFLAVSVVAGSSVTAPDITSAGGSAQPLTVVYTGASAAIDPTTISGSNITVIGPNNVVLTATVFNVLLSGASATVTYIVKPPDGTWQAADDGSYSVIVHAGAVKDVNGTGIAGSSTSFSVNAASPLVVALTSSDPTIAQGQAVTFTATLTGGTTPTGTVIFSSDGIPLGTALVGANATAALVIDSLGVGPHVVTAVYGGDATHPAANSGAPLLQTITPSLTTVVPGLTGALPAFVAVGAKTSIKQTINVASTGQGSFKGSLTVKTFLSIGTSVDAGSYLLRATTKTFRLKNEGSKSIKLSLAGLPAIAPPGTYHLVTVLQDASGRISEQVASRPLIIAAPNTHLIATNLIIPGTVSLGRKISGTLFVQNNGTVAARGRLLVVLYSSLSGVLDQTAAELKGITVGIDIEPGESVPIFLKNITTARTAGRSFIIADVDPANAFHEVNPANNVVSSNAIVAS